MSVNKATIEQSIKTLLTTLKNQEDKDGVPDKFASDLATIIKDAILSATITVPVGIAVQVTPATGTGATTASATAEIN